MASSPLPPQAERPHRRSPDQPYRGVSYDPANGRWRARLYCSGKHISLGRYESEEDAAFAYDRAAVFVHGDDAQTNFGVEAAQQANERGPLSSSYRLMSTLEMRATESKARRLALQRQSLCRSIAAQESAAASRAMSMAHAVAMRAMHESRGVCDEAAAAALEPAGAGSADARRRRLRDDHTSAAKKHARRRPQSPDEATCTAALIRTLTGIAGRTTM